MKRYYWLKLDKDFFQQKEIKKLRKIAGGDTYTIIYLKLQLISLKNEGVLIYEGVEDTFAAEIALEIDEEIENVKVTVAFLLQYGFLEEKDNYEYALPAAIGAIGSETAGAERVRRHREEQKALQCNTTVTLLKQTCNVEKRREEIDKRTTTKNTDARTRNTLSKDCQEANVVDNSRNNEDVNVVTPQAWLREPIIPSCPICHDSGKVRMRIDGIDGTKTEEVVVNCKKCRQV